jgi:hypothetical protein
MQRPARALVLLVFAGIQISVGGHIFDFHRDSGPECENPTSHFCAEVQTHEVGSCQICVLSSTSLVFAAIERPPVVQLTLTLVEADPASPILPPQVLYSDLRGPPAASV